MLQILRKLFSRRHNRSGHYYARIDQHSICRAILHIDRPLVRADAIQVDTMDIRLIGKYWNGYAWEHVHTGYPVPAVAAIPEAM